ncbi:60S ribosomal protein L28 [Amphibalanus amphitrite]|uniref:Large ribosomal subunit protein eL28 n=1 Tax=Amphibalanus amphitrite TaxID=1232801 RepID=A0A6A4V5Z5_AMPAM|nr:60S ribosomal protein L28 [Amphibalanus amphitrite]
MASAASPELVWQMIRNNHGSLMKARNIRRPFSKEANNLKNVNSYRFNGFVQKNVVGVEPMASGKGAVLITKKKRSSHKPGQSVLRQPLVKGKRVSIQKVRRALKGASYRKDPAQPGGAPGGRHHPLPGAAAARQGQEELISSYTHTQMMTNI